MTLSTILTSILVGVLCFIIIMYFAIQIEKYAEKKWMQASARQIIGFSGIIILMFSILLLASIIRIGWLIWIGQVK